MKQPSLTTITRVDIAEPQVETLGNGVKIYTLSCPEFEVLRVTFIFRAGSSLQSAPLTAAAAANLLAEGTEGYSARELTERLDYHGSWFNVNVDRDYAYISFAMLSKFYRETLDIAEELVVRPTFPEEEVATYCKKRRTQLEIEYTKVDAIGRRAFGEAMFGKEHPYGRSYEPSQYDTLTRHDILEFYKRHYTAENCFVVCSGRIGEEEKRRIAEIAELLPSRGRRSDADFPLPQRTPRMDVERKEAVQSSIRIGRMLFERTHPDFVGMQVVATLLGGYFGSRLMQNLRERNGYTYGVICTLINFEKGGYLAIGTQVGCEVTQAALREIFTEIRRLREEEVPEEELKLVKNIMAGEMMRILDGPFGIADVTIENILCGMDNAVINSNLQQIEAMTPAMVKALAEKYLQDEDFVTVVVGNDGTPQE